MINLFKKLLGFFYNIGYRNKIDYGTVSLKASIGKNVIIMKRSFVDSYTRIGSYTYIGYNCFISKSKIGRFVSIANNVSIGNGEHDINKVSTSSLFYENVYEELTKDPCIIGNDVWIGVDSVILRGVKIGDGAVIGANSVVTKDIPPFAVAVGSPARIIKYRFDSEKINDITTSCWWDKDIIEAREIIRNLEKKWDNEKS